MLITKMQLQSFLVLEKKILSFFLAYLGMAVILFSGTEPFKQIVNTVLTESPM